MLYAFIFWRNIPSVVILLPNKQPKQWCELEDTQVRYLSYLNMKLYELEHTNSEAGTSGHTTLMYCFTKYACTLQVLISTPCFQLSPPLIHFYCTLLLLDLNFYKAWCFFTLQTLKNILCKALPVPTHIPIAGRKTYCCLLKPKKYHWQRLPRSMVVCVPGGVQEPWRYSTEGHGQQEWWAWVGE